jgi:hypothetical protein
MAVCPSPQNKRGSGEKGRELNYNLIISVKKPHYYSQESSCFMVFEDL